MLFEEKRRAIGLPFDTRLISSNSNGATDVEKWLRHSGSGGCQWGAKRANRRQIYWGENNPSPQFFRSEIRGQQTPDSGSY